MSLLDLVFELGGVEFGCGRQVEVTSFTPGGSDVRSAPTLIPGSDARSFGPSERSPGEWAFTLKVLDSRALGPVREALAGLASVWDAPGARLADRAVLPLRYRLNGVWRLVYGRPQRFEPIVTNLAFGHLQILADFVRSDILHYADVERAMSSDLTGSTNPFGLSVPITWPISWASGTYVADSRTAIVGGDRPTWPILEFRGGSRPKAEMAGWSCQPLVDLNWDETVVVDTHPWVRSATLNGGSVPLARGTFLEDMSLPPGGHPVRYSSGPSNGQPSVTVRWRDAYISL